MVAKAALPVMTSGVKRHLWSIALALAVALLSDRYALTYPPESGAPPSRNGRPPGTIPGADFAVARSTIWIGPQPLDGSLKRALLASR